MVARTRQLNVSLLRMSGMVSVFFYTLHVVLGGMLWKGYNHLQQPISDLTATGAPNRALLQIIATLYGLLALLFALTVAFSASRQHHRLVYWGGITFVLLHVLSLLYGFFPEDLPNTAATFGGTMHIVVTGLIVPSTVATPLLIGFGLREQPRWQSFGRLSILAGFLLVLFGGITAFLFINKLPFFGLFERLNIAVLQLWTFCFSVKLVSVNETV